MDLRDQLKNLFPDHIESEETEKEDNGYTPTDAVLICKFEKKGRNGKPVTLIEGFENDEEMKDIGKKIKTSLGIGGSGKDGVLIFQGDNRDKIMQLLHSMNYKTKRVGG